MKPCKRCGEPVVGRMSLAVYCGEECCYLAGLDAKRERRERRPETRDVRCGCGSVFQASGKHGPDPIHCPHCRKDRKRDQDHHTRKRQRGDQDARAPMLSGIRKGITMTQPRIMMNAQDFKRRLEVLGPTEKLVRVEPQVTKAVWVRHRDGKVETMALHFAIGFDEANRLLADLAASERPSVDGS